LGDDIDDFCVRCHRITNHLIVSFLEAKPAKVRCRSCHSDHNYLAGKEPPSRKELLREKAAREAAQGRAGEEDSQPEQEKGLRGKATRRRRGG
jgi:hypothetical protein